MSSIAIRGLTGRSLTRKLDYQAYFELVSPQARLRDPELHVRHLSHRLAGIIPRDRSVILNTGFARELPSCGGFCFGQIGGHLSDGTVLPPIARAVIF